MRKSRGYKERAEKRALRNKAFLFGDQWYSWDQTRQQMSMDETRQKWQARLVYNQILTTVEQQTCQLIRNKRVWDTIPETTDEADRMKARTKGQILDYEYNQVIKFPKKLRESIQWALSSSCVFGHPFWNPDTGPELTVTVDDYLQSVPPPQPPANVPPEMHDQIMANLNQQHVQTQMANFAKTFGPQAAQQGGYFGREGDMDFDVAPIFEVGWWPYVKRWEDVLIWHRMVKMPCQKVSDLFGIPVDTVRGWMLVRGNAAGANTSRWADDYFNDNMEDQTFDDCVYVDKLWCPPSKMYPKGREACVIGQAEEAQYCSDLQNFANVVPLMPLSGKPIVGMIDGTCLVDQLISPQKNINTAASQIADYRNRRIMPTLVRFAGDKGAKESLSNKPGKIYDCNSPDQVPQVIKMPDIGADYFQTIQQDINFMHDIGGTAGVDLGNSSDGKSGRAILSLQQKNNERMIAFAEALDEWCENIGNFVDQEIQGRVKLDRVIQIIGDKNELEAVKYKGSDLWSPNRGTSKENKRLVRVRAFSSFPKSQEQIFNFINMAMETVPPMLDPVKDRDTIMEMIGFNDYREAFDKNRTDKAGAVDVIEKWEQVQSAGPGSDAQDHQTYYKILSEWKKTEKCKRAIAMAGAQMLGQGFNPLVQGNWLEKEIEERILSHKRGVIEDQVEQTYLARSADIRMWLQERERWLDNGNPMGPQIIQMFFPAPMNTPMMPMAVTPASKTDEQPEDRKMVNQPPPPTEGDGDGKDKEGERDRKKDKKAGGTDEQAAIQNDMSNTQKSVQQEMAQ